MFAKAFSLMKPLSLAQSSIFNFAAKAEVQVAKAAAKAPVKKEVT